MPRLPKNHLWGLLRIPSHDLGANKTSSNLPHMRQASMQTRDDLGERNACHGAFQFVLRIHHLPERYLERLEPRGLVQGSSCI